MLKTKPYHTALIHATYHVHKS